MITQPLEVINEMLAIAENDPTTVMTVDLPNQSISYNGKGYHFDYDGFRKHCLINGLDDLDYLMSHTSEINKYEEHHGKA